MVSLLRFVIPLVERAEAYQGEGRDDDQAYRHDPSDIWDEPEHQAYLDTEACRVYLDTEASRRQAYIHLH